MEKTIAMILDDFLPDRRVEREAIALVNAGFKVSLFCFGGSKNTSLSKVDVQVVAPSRFARKAKAVAVDFPFYHMTLRKHLRAFLKSVQPDVIHIHDMTIAGLVFALKPKVKIVLDLHENRPEIMKFYPHLHRFPGKFLINPARWKRKEEAYVRKADLLIVVTNEAREDYKRLNEHVAVVPNFVSKQEIEQVRIDQTILNRFEDKFAMVYVGDLGKRRGIMESIQVVERVKEQIPSIHLVLVGDSSDRPGYEDYIQTHGLADFVSLEGYQPHEKLFSYIKAAKVGLSPLHRNRHHDTTYANKIFQYMAMGKSQIVSNCPAQAKVIEDLEIGITYDADNLETFDEAVIRCYSDRHLSQRFEDNALKAFQTLWNWEHAQKELVQVYAGLF